MDSTAHLVVRVRLHDGRFHGVPEWPPAPARLFQALIAACGPTRTEAAGRALAWLEALDPPTITAVHQRAGQEVTLYVPNNDLDAFGGDPDAIASIRTQKRVRPRLLDEPAEVSFAWELPPGDESHAMSAEIGRIALDLYQLGRGVDPAWANAEVVRAAPEADASRERWRPTPGGEGGTALACPIRGTLASLDARHTAMRSRFTVEGKGKEAVTVFVQPPKPAVRMVPYESPPARVLFDLVPAAGDVGRLFAWRLERAVALVEAVRDAGAARLAAAVPALAPKIESAWIGRGEPRVRAEDRVRLVPLPSIGHEQVDPSIRRVLAEIPATCPLGADDVLWALSGLGVGDVRLVRADDGGMLEHYQGPGRHFASITPVALPVEAARRRIDPERRAEEGKGGSELAHEQVRAAFAVRQALRHAGILAAPGEIHVQREPFRGKGARAEAFAPETRFAKERLWHVRLVFDRPVAGPLAIGDGRFLGLGVLAPETLERTPWAVHFLEVRGGLERDPSPEGLAEALRRAVMSLAQAEWRGKRLPAAFTGHGPEGGPASGGGRIHFGYDAGRNRLFAAADPEVREAERAVLARVVRRLTTLRAGAAGVLDLGAMETPPGDPLIAPSRVWVSLTDYTVTRHAKVGSAYEALAADLLAECVRAELPRPGIEILGAEGGAGGLRGRARLTFATAVRGPLFLGRTRFSGGGTFAGPGAG